MASIGSVMKSNAALPAGAKERIMSIQGKGKNLFTQLYTTIPSLRFYIKCDEVPLMFGLYDYVTTANLNGWGYDANTPGISLMEYNAVEGQDNMLIITFAFSWEKDFIIEVENKGAIAGWAITTVTYEKPPLPPPSDVQEPQVVTDPQM